MTVRIKEIIHNAVETRTFVMNSRLHDGADAYITSQEQARRMGLADIYYNLSRLPLVTSVTLKAYEVGIKIVDGFNREEQSWDAIREKVCSLITEQVGFNKYTHEKELSVYHDANKIKLPYELFEHKSTWRRAISNNIEELKEMAKNEKVVGIDGDIAFMENELKVFDETFKKLHHLATLLPVDNA